MNLTELGTVPDLKTQIEAERCRRDFAYFCKRAWVHTDPAELVWNWHHDAICLHLQALFEGKFQKLIINVPPGHTKTTIVSKMFPAWAWARKPSWTAILSSYGNQLATETNVASRRLIESSWYQQLFARDWKLREDQNNKSHFSNTKGGSRITASVGASATGKHADCLIFDDPLAAHEANSKAAMHNVTEWHSGTMRTRFKDQKTGTQVLIMQRLHESDLAGHLMRTDPLWVKLILPTEFEPANRCKTKLKDGTPFWSDPRSKEGELLYPDKFDAERIAQLKKDLGSYAYAAQHQQRPVPADGGMIKLEFFRNRWDTLPAEPEAVHIFVDAAFKDTDDSDRVAIGVFMKAGPQLYLADMRWGRMGFVQTVNAIKELRAQWPMVRGIHIEDKANGSAVIEVLKTQVPGVIPITPNGGKESRVAAITSYLEAGNLVLPKYAGWVDDYIAEAVAFPKAQHDDALDMTAYAMTRMLTNNKLLRFLALAKA